MANNILVSVHDSLQSPPWLTNVEPFLQNVMRAASFDGQELSVLFCGDAFIQELNAQYRNINSPTDVLSFEDGSFYTDDEGNEWLCLGDIIISLETLPKNAAYFGVSADEELKRLLIHGLLHVNGYDHGEEHVENGVEPQCEMLKLQKNLLEQFCDVHIIEENEGDSC